MKDKPAIVMLERIDELRDKLLAEQCKTANLEADIRRLKGSCPCKHTEPCSPNCTCVHPTSSGGCSRCCSYGSKEQQKANAERLSTLEAEVRNSNTVIRALNAENELLIGKCKKLLSLLRILEWKGVDIDLLGKACPCCSAHPPGHYKDCALGNALKDSE